MTGNAALIKVLDWNDYHSYIDKLSNKINATKYKYIVGVDSDDMIVAIHLSHKLSMPALTDINVLSFLINLTDDASRVLIVSNVVETGNSFKEIMTQTKCHFDTAVIFKDRNSKYSPTYFVETPNERIYFPWQKCGLGMEK